MDKPVLRKLKLSKSGQTSTDSQVIPTFFVPEDMFADEDIYQPVVQRREPGAGFTAMPGQWEAKRRHRSSLESVSTDTDYVHVDPAQSDRASGTLWRDPQSHVYMPNIYMPVMPPARRGSSPSTPSRPVSNNAPPPPPTSPAPPLSSVQEHHDDEAFIPNPAFINAPVTGLSKASVSKDGVSKDVSKDGAKPAEDDALITKPPTAKPKKKPKKQPELLGYRSLRRNICTALILPFLLCWPWDRTGREAGAFFIYYIICNIGFFLAIVLTPASQSVWIIVILSIPTLVATIRFAAAVLAKIFGRKIEYRDDLHGHVVMMVPCYTEDRAGLTATLDSMAASNLRGFKGTIVAVCDGRVIGLGATESCEECLTSMMVMTRTNVHRG